MAPLSFEDALNNDRIMMDRLVPIKTMTPTDSTVPAFDDFDEGFVATKPMLTRTISHASLDAHDTDIEQRDDVTTPKKSPSLAPEASDHNVAKSPITSQATTTDAADLDAGTDITSAPSVVKHAIPAAPTKSRPPKLVSPIQKQKSKVKNPFINIALNGNIMDWRKKLYYSPDITPLPTSTPIRVETLELLLKLAKEPVYA